MRFVRRVKRKNYLEVVFWERCSAPQPLKGNEPQELWVHPYGSTHLF